MYDRPVEVHGKSGAEPSSNVPHTCTLILRSASGHQRNNLLIEVIRVTIKQCDVHLTIYNGDPGEGTLVSVVDLSEHIFFTIVLTSLAMFQNYYVLSYCCTCNIFPFFV